MDRQRQDPLLDR